MKITVMGTQIEVGVRVEGAKYAAFAHDYPLVEPIASTPLEAMTLLAQAIELDMACALYLRREQLMARPANR